MGFGVHRPVEISLLEGIVFDATGMENGSVVVDSCLSLRSIELT